MKFEGSLLHSFILKTSFGSSFVSAHHGYFCGGLLLFIGMEYAASDPVSKTQHSRSWALGSASGNWLNLINWSHEIRNLADVNGRKLC